MTQHPTNPGAAPRHAGYPQVRAALASLDDKLLANVPDSGWTCNPAVTGIIVAPRPDGRICLYWAAQGRIRDTRSRPHTAHLHAAVARLLRTDAWLVDTTGDVVVTASHHQDGHQSPSQQGAVGQEAPYWAVTDADGRDVHRFESSDPLEAIREYEHHPAVRSAKLNLRRISLRRLSTDELAFTIGQRVRHVPSDRSGVVEVASAQLVTQAGRVCDDVLKATMDRATSLTARAHEWAPE
ncbi:hypothetical protein OIE69_43520 (plasmid) [Actinacidiphila glaucinigra]|uniref:hypothetical protein n=1 Tax=Actinacidiphila glaucinigra TaxID=235986 RepID=UPI002DDC3D26|nr:hypothetical protein [Actinacidiphila glaucinigra]WSD65779.1 hypothetical protein OIE69_43520 [Actinacidiphila glaucinigra]